MPFLVWDYFSQRNLLQIFCCIKFSKFHLKGIVPVAAFCHIFCMRLKIVITRLTIDLIFAINFKFLQQLNFTNFENWQFSDNFCKIDQKVQKAQNLIAYKVPNLHFLKTRNFMFMWDFPYVHHKERQVWFLESYSTGEFYWFSFTLIQWLRNVTKVKNYYSN